jgi:hypothetical protein
MPSRPRLIYFAMTSLSITFDSSGSCIRVLLLMSRVTGAVLIFVVEDKPGSGGGTVLRTIGAYPLDTPAIRLVVIVLASFLVTLSCSDFVFGYQTRAPIPKNTPKIDCKTVMCFECKQSSAQTCGAPRYGAPLLPI